MSGLFSEIFFALRDRWGTEKEIFSKHKRGIIALSIGYYVCGIITNILRHYTIVRPALWDFGFQSTQNINYNPLYNLTVLFRIVLYSLTLVAVFRFYVANRHAALSIILLKFFTVLVAIMFLRVGTLMSTQLPPPHSSCTSQYISPVEQQITPALSLGQWIEAMAPWNIPLPFSIIPRVLCGGDHTFSLHVIGIVLCVLTCIKYASVSYSLWVIVAALMNLYMLIAMRLNYTLDLWVGTFTSVLVFLFLDRKLTAYFANVDQYIKLGR